MSSDSSDFQKHLLIDGYNVLHSWTWLRELAVSDVDAARARLAETVRPIHDQERVRVSLVFDGRAEELSIERPGGVLTFSLIFAPASMSADELIERLVGGAERPDLCVVATRDHMEMETVTAHGALAISPDELAAWAERCVTRQSDLLREQQRKNKLAWGNRLEF